MWDLFSHSLRLFLRGKLFREPRQVLRQWALGVAIGAIALLLLAALGTPLWLAVLLTSAGGGALQPWLFKDLKYN